MCIGSEEHERAFTYNAKRIVQAAKDVCASCPVIEQCLEQVMEQEGDTPAAFRHGVSAGLTPQERMELFVRRLGAIPHPSAANAPTAPHEGDYEVLSA